MSTLKTRSSEMTETENSGEQIGDTHAVKVLRTILMICSWICMGLYSEITGPTLQSLMARVDSNYEEISRALVARSMGFFAGSLIGGIICQRWSRLIDLWMGLALLLAAIATAAAPWSGTLALLGALFFLDGTAKGILAVGANSYIILLWKEKSAMPTQALHFAFGIGALTAPQICRPFLPHTEPMTTLPPLPTSPLPSAATSTGFDIEIAYFIVACICILGALSFVPLYTCYPPKIYVTPEPGESCGRSFLNMVSPASCYTGSKVRGVIFMVITLIFFALPVGAERAYGKFIYSFATDEMGFTSGDATTLETVFWASFTAGRGLATLAASWVSPAKLIIAELAVHLLSTGLLSALAGREVLALWVCSGLFGSCMAPLFPTGITWANTVMDMTAVLTGFSFIATACGAFAFSWISGALFEYYGPMSLMYFMASYAVFATVLFAILHVLSGTMKASPSSYDVSTELDESKKMRK